MWDPINSIKNFPIRKSRNVEERETLYPYVELGIKLQNYILQIRYHKAFCV